MMKSLQNTAVGKCNTVILNYKYKLEYHYAILMLTLSTVWPFVAQFKFLVG